MTSPLRFPEILLEMGIDEAGRGPLCGRVYAAAVILDPSKPLPPKLNDSKKITPKQRGLLRTWIEREAVAWAVGFAEAAEIDEINILQATYRAMHRAIERIRMTHPEATTALVDGNRFSPPDGVTYRCEPKADGTWAHVAAASILAKEHHDEHIRGLVAEDPRLHERYDLLSNVGYPAPKHLAGLRQYGPSLHHRKTFRGVVKE